ncbi:MAG: hypothetical protein HYU68_01030 [Bacteroidetes bacterium]|nr:hypothetical protein [Bacteroidota bacterium]
MRQLLYFFAFFLLLACNDLTNTDFFDNKKDSDLKKISETITTSEDSVVYAENVSPDGSWQVNINLKEGYFWGYTVVYNIGKIITKKINSGIELTGKMNDPKAKWMNDTTYKIQNIGATTTGHYELIIYKSAACKYIEHFKEEKDTTEVVELMEGDSATLTHENNDKKEPEIINSYSQTDNYIVFTQTLKNYNNSSTGSNSSETNLSIVIQNYTDSFEYNNEELNVVKLNYSFTDGLNDISGDKPFKGYLKGKLLPDNTWEIELDLWISIFSYVDNEKGKKQIKTSGIFKP